MTTKDHRAERVHAAMVRLQDRFRRIAPRVIGQGSDKKVRPPKKERA